MSLSERLKRAQTERLLAAGLVNSEAALKPPAPDDDPDDDDSLFVPVMVEVHAAGLHAVADPAPIVHLEEGLMDRGASCPNCRGAGVVDMVDLVGHRIHYSCPRCGTLWQARHEPAEQTTS